jgi:uncharacterized protein
MIRKYFCIIFVIICLPADLFSDNKFKPWNSDVSIGDENISVKTTQTNKEINLFGGPQSGAFFMIRFFQIFISPQDGPNCRFRPSCSRYGQIAVLKYGALMGSILAGDRLLRCNPYNESGEDPVPEFLFKQNPQKSSLFNNK